MPTLQWTNTAREEYRNILRSVYESSVDKALDLDEKIEILQDRLFLFKSLCPPHPEIPTLRRCVVTQTVALIYDVDEEIITVISVVDTRSSHPLN